MNDYVSETFTTALPTTRVVSLHSDLFLDSYLNPVPVGCTAHGDPECLCDVDASLTAGFSWQLPPRELWGVHDAEGLVRAAANIWLTKDLCKWRQEVQDGSLDRLEEQLPELAKLAREYYTYDEIVELDYQITRDEWRLICEAVGTLSHSARVPDGRIRELRLKGYSYRRIIDRIFEETGRRISLASIGKSLARTGAEGRRQTPIPSAQVERWLLEGLTADAIIDRLHAAGYTHVWRQSIKRIERRVLAVAD